MYRDHEFDPITPEEEARRREEAEFARRVRREVRRMERGEADEGTFWQIFSGSILVRKGVSQYYPYLLTIAGTFFLSIVVMFWSLHLDMRYTRLSRDVQKLRERSIRLQEQRFQRTTHSAIIEELHARGIDLYDLWDACSSAKVRIVFAEEPNFDLDTIVDQLIDRLGESIRRRFNGHVRAMGDYCYYVPPEDLEDDVPAEPHEDDYDAEDSEIFCDGWMRASTVEEESENEPEIDDDVTRIIRTWCISSRIMADTLAQVLERHGIDMDAYGQDGDPDE